MVMQHWVSAGTGRQGGAVPCPPWWGYDRRPLVRARRDEDIPVVVKLLTEQQPVSRYPFRWPLPFPVEQFIVRGSEQAAWVCELD